MRRESFAWAGGVALLITHILSVASCGLPSYPALYPPLLKQGPVSVEAGLDIIIGITGNDDPAIFEGLELYYKLYTFTQVDGEQIDSDTLRVVDRNTLVSHGFRRFLNATSTGAEGSKPLIPLADDDKIDSELDLLLDFSPLIATVSPAVYPVLTYGEISVSLGRNVSANPAEYTKKGFAANDFAGTDADLPDGFFTDDDGNTSKLYIAMYAMTYGNDYTSIVLNSNILSQPTYLGYIAIPGQ